MTLTTLDPTPALVVVDLQKGVLALPTAHPATQIVERSARLADAFRRRGLPVVLVNATGRAPGRTEAGSLLAGRTPTTDGPPQGTSRLGYEPPQGNAQLSDGRGRGAGSARG